MRWKGRRGSRNVVDSRGSAPRRGMAIGGGTIVLALLAVFLLGQDPGEVIRQVNTQTPGTNQPAARPAAEDQAAQFVSVVFADTEEVWGELFRRAGSQYREPKLRLYLRPNPNRLRIWLDSHRPILLPRR